MKIFSVFRTRKNAENFSSLKYAENISNLKHVENFSPKAYKYLENFHCPKTNHIIKNEQKWLRNSSRAKSLLANHLGSASPFYHYFFSSKVRQVKNTINASIVCPLHYSTHSPSCLVYLFFFSSYFSSFFRRD